jgi:hypothetical protein
MIVQMLLLFVCACRAVNDFSCDRIATMLNRTHRSLESSSGQQDWLRFDVVVADDRPAATLILAALTPTDLSATSSPTERNVRLMRRRAHLARWRANLAALRDSRHLVAMVGSAMHCGANSGILLSRVKSPVVAPRDWCALVDFAAQLVELLDDLKRVGSAYVLCDWHLQQFGLGDDGTVLLHDVGALHAVLADAPLLSDVVCSSDNHTTVCSTLDTRLCMSHPASLPPDELTCRGAVHGTAHGVCSGIDERINVWNLGAMLSSLLSSITASDNRRAALETLLESMQARSASARPSTGDLLASFDRLRRECNFGKDQRVLMAAADGVKLSFGSRNEAIRAKGGKLLSSSGAPGSTPHCFLHAQFPHLCAPYFLCIGAQKGGTQTFLDWIQEHPNVVMAEQELHFWDYGGIERTLADYYDDLPLVAPGKRRNGAQIVVGEKTPRYSVEAHPLAVHAHFPQMRLVFLVRDPVARAFSHFLHLRRRADQTWRGRQFQFSSFADAIRHSLFNINALHACGNPLLMSWSALHQCVRDNERPVTFRELTEHPADMLFRGLYAPIVARWSRPYFPLGSQLLVVRSETLFEQPYETMALITRFLNLTAIDWREALPLATARERNRKNDEAGASLASLGATNMTMAERALLIDFYSPYERDLTAILDQQRVGI